MSTAEDRIEEVRAKEKEDQARLLQAEAVAKNLAANIFMNQVDLGFAGTEEEFKEYCKALTLKSLTAAFEFAGPTWGIKRIMATEVNPVKPVDAKE
jgi:hypothetical protein